jgi:hypothetical protein
MSTIKTETLSTPSNATVPVDTVVNGTAKAWVNFNGTSTVAIRRAFNVSSITDNGTGDYTVNFTTAMPDANYAASEITNWSTDARTGFCRFNSAASSSLSVKTGVASSSTNNGVASDLSNIMIVIFS